MMADVMEEYQSSLEDLTFNSKPHINMLTILAEENKGHAESVVHLIEAQIAKAPEKLPLLYLLDSIIKNVGENFKPLFAKNLVTTFKTAFQSSDDKSKMSMYKLRLTWDNYFPLKKLHALDSSINELDPNWPVKPLPAHLQDNAATNIHVNPKFIKPTSTKTNQPSASTIKTSANIVKPPASSGQHSDAEVDKIRQQLVRQQKELLDLQQKKLILELEQTKQQLAAKQKEVKQSAAKKQEKVSKDTKKPVPMTSAAGIRVTLSNVKPTTANVSSVAPKDPRLKVSSTAAKIGTTSSNKTETAKAVTVSAAAKKKVSKTAIKKEKPAKSTVSANVAAISPKTTPEKKSMGSKKKTVTTSVESDRKKKRSLVSKSSPSPSPPPAKVARPIPASLEQRKRSKAITEKSQRKNQRAQKLKEQKQERSIERSLSPRFSPEPDTDDQQSPMNISPSFSYNKRGDALRRRPSFDPDLHIPKELTLTHQNEILKQADLQLRSGQLTHKQHQELLKQLHQLFEVQRMKKIQAANLQHREIPEDPRSRRRDHIRHVRSEDPRLHEELPPDRLQRDKRMSPDHPKRLPPKHLQDAQDRYRPPGRRPLGPYETGPNRERRPRYPLSDPRQPSSDKFRKPTPRYPSHPAHESSGLKEQSSLDDQRNQKLQDRRLSQKRPLLPLPPQQPAKRKGPYLNNPPIIGGSKPRRPGPLLPTPSQDVSQNRGPGKDSSYMRFKSSDNQSSFGGERPLSPPPRPPLSPPPFFVHHGQQSSGVNLENQEPFLSEEMDKKSNLRQYAHGKPTHSKEVQSMKRSNKTSMKRAKPPFNQQGKQIEEKKGPEEPEDYIIDNISRESSPKGLEEPEDYIIAGMSASVEEEKNSCEEPEDFIIAGMPPGAEAYHNHSIGLRRNSDLEKAYVDHMKKIKQSMYTRELHESKKASEVESTSTAEESESEKPSTPTESSSEKEGIKSPPLPLKKRRYISAEGVVSKDKTEEKSTKEEKPDKKVEEIKKVEDAADETQTENKDEALKVQTKTLNEEALAQNALSEKEENSLEKKDIAAADKKSTSEKNESCKNDATEKKELSPSKKQTNNKDPTITEDNAGVMTAKEKDLKLRKALEKRLGKDEVDKKFSKSDAEVVEKDSNLKSKPEVSKKTFETKDDSEATKKVSKTKDNADVDATKTLPKAKSESDFKKMQPKSKDDVDVSEKVSKSKDDSVLNKKLTKDRFEHRKKFPKSQDDSLVYVIEEEDEIKGPPLKNMKDPRLMRRGVKRPIPLRPEGRHRGRPLAFQEEEEARLQQLMKEEQEKLEWEEKLTRQLEREQWKEDQMRRGRMRKGRGRARYMPTERWESPPHDLRDPGNFDIARGKIFHRDPNSRIRPLMSGDPHLGLRPPFPSKMDDIRMRRPPMDDPRRPPSPGMKRPSGPGWDSRRPVTPPGLRLPPHPPYHNAPDERRLEWELHSGRIPPRDPMFRTDDRRRSPIEFHRVPADAPPPPPTFKQVNVDKLLTDLLSMGIIPGNKKQPEVKSESPVPAPTSLQTEDVKPASPTTEPGLQEQPAEDNKQEDSPNVAPFIEKEDLMILDPDADLPDIDFSSDLKIRHDEIIKRLYTGIQCSACGLRFTTRQTDLYADHLDWHYRLNRKDKEGGASTHRELYPTAGEWICFEEIVNPEDRARSTFFDETENPDNFSKVDINDSTVPLTGNAGEDICKVCKEAFETFYNEIEDEWQFANCIKVDNFNYHPNCYSDRHNIPPPLTPLISPTEGIPGLDTLKEEPMETVMPPTDDAISIKIEPLDKTYNPPDTTFKNDLTSEAVAVKVERESEIILPVKVEIKQEREEFGVQSNEEKDVISDALNIPPETVSIKSEPQPVVEGVLKDNLVQESKTEETESTIVSIPSPIVIEDSNDEQTITESKPEDDAKTTQSTVPDTQASTSSDPDSQTIESSAPDIQAKESSVSDTQATASSDPDTQAKESLDSDTQAKESFDPDAQAKESSVPEAEAIESSFPDIQANASLSPDTQANASSVPDAQTKEPSVLPTLQSSLLSESKDAEASANKASSDPPAEIKVFIDPV